MLLTDFSKNSFFSQSFIAIQALATSPTSQQILAVSVNTLLILLSYFASQMFYPLMLHFLIWPFLRFYVLVINSIQTLVSSAAQISFQCVKHIKSMDSERELRERQRAKERKGGIIYKNVQTIPNDLKAN